MSNNGTASSENQQSGKGAGGGKRAKGRSTADLVAQPMAPAVILENGQYPARFFKWAEETFFLRSPQFGVSEKLEGYFAVRNTHPEAGGVVRIVRVMVNAPGSKELHPKANLYKLVKPLAAGDDQLWDKLRDNVRSGTQLSAFVGKTAMVQIEQKNGFPNITGVSTAPVGIEVPYPSLEEAQAAFEASQKTEDDDAGEDSHIPF